MRLFFFIITILCYLQTMFSSSLSSFSAADTFLISCGENKAIQDEYGRVFEPDSGNSKIDFDLSTKPDNTSVVISTTTQNGVSKLYNSARIFTNTAIYKIRTKQTGKHWLRLHFHPDLQDHNTSQYNLKSATFSVLANEFTLLHGFSFSKSNETYPLVKEYVVDISEYFLQLSLSPWSGSIAFLNGIEVLSVPDGQFGNIVIPISTVSSSYVIPSRVAFQTIYRVNMGGPLLTPTNDTLWRVWESDDTYLVNKGSAHSVSKDPGLIRYPAGESVDIAPNWVYSTAQEMAEANVSDPMFNITWAFNVDKGFDYFVRMHFCDIVSVTLGSLIFNIYINTKSGVNFFDISRQTMDLSSAYFIDFAINGSIEQFDKIIVQVGPPTQRTLPTNAILNGLEILKMSNPENSLDQTFGNSSSKYKHAILVAFACLGGGLIIFVIMFVVIYFLCFYKLKKENKKRTNVGNSQTKISSTNSFASTEVSRGLGRSLALNKIREATKDFNESLIIGVGGFGKVYMGMLENGVTVAVKRGNSKSQQGLLEFKTEIEMLSKLRHRHLVSLIGYCEELNEMILVYEFMASGPLRKHLYGSGFPSLSWKRRLEICIGAAKGLHYLHTGAAECIIHRDVKTTNILLDENFTAKVADFGLSKLGPTSNQTHVSTAVKGSFGYLDPEYYRRQQLSEKSDVYSFGVVLLEVLCARPVIDPSLPTEEVNIAEWAMNWQKKGLIEQIIDPHLVGSVSIKSIKKFGETAEKCLAEYGRERPTMGDVLWNLEYALQLQEAYMHSSIDDSYSTNYIPNIPEWLSHSHVHDVETMSNQESDTTTSTSVFSEIINPKGR